MVAHLREVSGAEWPGKSSQEKYLSREEELDKGKKSPLIENLQTVTKIRYRSVKIIENRGGSEGRN